MNLYFENIRVVNPYQNMDQKLNLWIKNGKIAHLSNDVATIDSETKKIDANNLVAAPGLFDMHVHFREPGQVYKEDIQTGVASAANGGYTSVVCMPNTEPAIDDVTVISYIKEKAQNLPVNVHVSGAITKGRKGTHIAPMLEMDEAGALFFTDDGSCVSDSEVMRRAFDFAASKDLMICQHCEDHDLTKAFAVNESEMSYKLGLKGYPNIAEDIIVSRDIMLANYLGNRKYHVAHLSSKKSVELVREAKSNGQRVSCEVTPHHIALTDDLAVNYDPNEKMNPPLRKSEDIEALVAGLFDGTVDCIATDHAPHALHEKDVEFEKAPCGILGLETSLGVCLTELVHKRSMDMTKLIELMSTNARTLLGLPSIKFENDLDAEMVIFDPNEEWTVDKNKFKSKSTNTPFNGTILKGKPKFVINNNQIVDCNL